MTATLEPPAAADVAPTAAPTVRELTFALTPEHAAAVERWLAGNATAEGPRRRVLTVCLDTAKLDVYAQSPGFGRRRYRIRWQAGSDQADLELKRSSRGRARVRHTAVSREAIASLGDPEREDAGECPYAWFRRQVRVRRLRPVCAIGFERTTYALDAEEGAIRADLDRDVVCWRHRAWSLDRPGPGEPVGGPEVTLELRIAGSLPVGLRRLLCELRLAPGARSKYRAAIDTLGMARVQEA